MPDCVAVIPLECRGNPLGVMISGVAWEAGSCVLGVAVTKDSAELGFSYSVYLWRR